MNDCADYAKQAIKAHAIDFWGKVSVACTQCRADQQYLVKAEIIELLNIFVSLLDSECAKLKESTYEALPGNDR